MLRRVPRSQVRLGMYIRSIEGSWLHHPFWKTKFLLQDPADLAALRSSDISAVLIDERKGAGVAKSMARPKPKRPKADAAPVKEQAPAPLHIAPATPSPAPQCSAAEEVHRASQILNRSKQAVMQLFNEARLGKAAQVAEVLPLVEEISASVARNPSALISIARLKSKDDYTYMHSVAVCALMVNLARQLDLDEAAVHDAGVAGLLHDMGKMLMPMTLLNKPGKLTREEYAIMKTHAERGYEMLRENGAVPEIALDVCLHHHEKMDGTGYPRQLKGDQISLFSRMGAVCDVYDAITSNRPYKKAWGASETLAEMFRWQGHFDERILSAFIRSVGIYPVGTLVKLHSDRLGLVIDMSQDDLTKPVVRVFFSTRKGTTIPMHDLDIAQSPGGDHIVSRENPEQWGFTPWDAYWTNLMGLANFKM